MRLPIIVLFLLISYSCYSQNLSSGMLLAQARFQPPRFTQGVYYGNSLVLGAGASLGTNRWTTRLSVRYTIPEMNFGVGGQTMMQVPINNFIVSSFISKPNPNALIFLEWSINDSRRFFLSGEGSLSMFITDYTTALNFLVSSRGWEYKDIIVITGMDYDPVSGMTKAQYITWCDALVVLCQSLGVKYVTNFPDYTSADGIHPDDAGYIVFTDYVETTMRNKYLIVSP